MVAVSLYIVLLILSLAAVALNILSLPGNWLMLVAAVGLSAFNGWHQPPLWLLGIIVAVLLVGEGMEVAGSVMGAKKFGASTPAAWAAFGGALLGGMLGFLIPIPLIGNIVGAVAGAFLAALGVELQQQKGMKKATWAATGAAIGRVVGMTSKIACGFVAWLCLMIFAFPT